MSNDLNIGEICVYIHRVAAIHKAGHHKMQGKVKFFRGTWGIITVDDTNETIFVHESGTLQEGYRKLTKNEIVQFDIETDEQEKTKAINVQKLE